MLNDTSNGHHTSPADWARVEQAVGRFEDSWQRGQRPVIADYLPAGATEHLDVLVELVHTDLEYRLKAGEAARVEEYGQMFPELAGRRETILELIAAEYELRRRLAQPVTVDEYVQRFPQYQEEVLALPNRLAGPSKHSIQETSSDRKLERADSEPPDLPGYTLLGELGRGGMGVVYKARQLSLKRVVAVKMILAGARAGAEDVARFLNEAEAAARLEHPHIVRIYEVARDARPPYFTAEFVEGGSLAQKTAGSPQPARPAAQLVETLARAMHYAHQRGVVHRDLKPANILLQGSQPQQGTTSTKEEPGAIELRESGATVPLSSPLFASFVPFCGQLTPKITDFGLAKRLDAGLGLTQTGAIVGTPSYMAPEQAVGQSKEIGPAADVYALGAILYELLTGRPPFQGEMPLDILQQVVADEPVSPRRLQPRVPRDLETICLKCLEKQPRQRYASAEDLADDLRRFLNNEPITARPVGPLARLGRWCRRRPLVAGLAAALLVVFAAGFAGVTWKWLEADEYRRHAEEQRDRAEHNFRLVEQQRRLAARHLSRSLETNAALFQLAQQLKPVAGIKKSLVGKVLQVAIANTQFPLQKGLESDSLREGRARLLNSYSEIFIDLGDTRQALASAREAQALFARLRAAARPRLRWQAGLALSLEKAGTALAWQGDLSRAMAAYRQSRDLRAQLVRQDRDNPNWQLDLSTSDHLIGNLLVEQGDYPGAQQAYQKALALRRRLAARHRDDPEWQARLALSHEKDGDAWWYLEDYARARAAYQTAAASYRDLVARDDTNADWQQALARITVSLGQARAALGQVAPAQKSFQEALALAERFTRLDPSSVEWQRLTMQCRWLLSDLVKGGLDESALRNQLAVARELHRLTKARVRQDPRNAQWRNQHAAAKWLIALDLSSLALRGAVPRKQSLAEALRYLQEARDLRAQLVRAEPADYLWRLGLQVVLGQISFVLQAQGDRAGAQATRLEAKQVFIDFFRYQSQHHPDNPLWRRGLARAYRDLAVTQTTLGNHKAALEAHRQSLKCCERLARQEPANHPAQHLWARACQWVSEALHVQALAQVGIRGDRATLEAIQKSPEYVESLTRYQQAVGIYERLVKQEPKNILWRRKLVDCYRDLPSKLRQRDDQAGAAAAFQHYLDALVALFALDPAEARRDPFTRAPSTSTAVQAIGQFLPEGIAHQRQSVQLAEKSYRAQPTPARAQELIDGYIQLVRSLDLSKKEAVAEARRALQSGLALLRQLQAENKLHRVQQRLIPFFEAALKRLPPEPKPAP